MTLLKCPLCQATEFMPSTPNGDDRAVYSYSRERGKVKRERIGEIVLCTRCDASVAITGEESYVLPKSRKKSEAAASVYAVDNGKKPAHEADAEPVRLRP